MPISLSHRDKETGQVVTVPYDNGVTPPAEAAPDGQASGVLAAPPAPPEGPEGSAPQPTSEAPAPSVAGGQGAEDGDDTDLPETATVDYVARRINRLTARLRAQERQQAAREQQWTQREAYWQGQLEAQARLLQGATPELPQAPSGPPQAEQFQDWDTYQTAKTRYEVQQVLHASQVQQQEAQFKAAQASRVQRFQEIQASLRPTHPDIDTHVQQMITLEQQGRLAPHLAQVIFWHDQGPRFAAHLATHPEDLARMNQMPAPLALIAFGEWATRQPALPAAATLERTEVTTTPDTATPVSQQPPPPASATPTATPPAPLPEPLRPVGGTATSAPAGFDPTTATQEEFRKHWNEGWRPTPADFQRR